MFLIIFSFLRQHWLLVAEGILLATVGIQHLEVSHLRHALAECRSQNAAWVNANAKLSAAVENQNTAVAELQAVSERKKAAAAKALIAAESGAGRYAAKAARFTSWNTSGNDCATMMKMLNDYVKQGG